MHVKAPLHGPLGLGDRKFVCERALLAAGAGGGCP